MAGPLTGIRIIEIAGIGPAPFAAMMLADHGAEVIRVDRPGRQLNPEDVLSRSRRSICLDLKKPESLAIVRDLCRGADGLIEGYRPGVMERLGLGPDVLLADNPNLVFGRMTGWGQSGPRSQAAGHDINYIAVSGLLHTVGRAGEGPTVPVNYLGDFGGGGMVLAFGMVSALLNVRSGGAGQVVDAAMTEGSALLGALTWSLYQRGLWRDAPGENIFDGGAPFYGVYATSDRKWVSIGALEPQFYAELVSKLDLATDPAFAVQNDRAAWPAMRAKFTAVFASQTRAHWEALLSVSDTCFAPVLSLAEVEADPHNMEREAYIDTIGGGMQPAPAPRYSVTTAAVPRAPGTIGSDGEAVLAELGYSEDRIGAALESGALIAPSAT